MNANGHTQAGTGSVAGKWGVLIFWLTLSALEIWVLIFGNLRLEYWKDWAIVLGAVFFPFMALWSATELTRDHGLTGFRRVVATTIKWMLAALFVLVATFLFGGLLFSVLGWFATIPGWAAVIIILLLLRR